MSASDGMVVVCVAIYNGTLERDVSVLIMTSTDSSTSMYILQIDLYYIMFGLIGSNLFNRRSNSWN